MNGCDVGKLAAALADTTTTTEAKVHTLGFKKGLIERSEVEALTTILLARYVAAGPDKIGFADIAQLFDLVEQVNLKMD